MSETIKLFFEDVGKNPLLTREEEVMLSKRIEKGDKRARDRMIASNIRLAISIAKKYQNKGCPLEDLIQESNIGLIKAVDRFDWRRGFKFSTYACWWIKQSVRRHLASHSSSIRLPSYAKNMLWKLKNVAQEYEDEFGVPPSQPELAELLGVSVESMKSIIACAGSSISLDADVNYRNGGGGGRRIQDLIPDERGMSPDDVIDRQKVSNIVRKAMGTLTEREEKIIRLRFGISENPKDTKGFPISKGEIKQLKKQSRKQKKAGVSNYEHA